MDKTAIKTAKPSPRSGVRLPLGNHPGNSGGKKGRSGRVSENIRAHCAAVTRETRMPGNLGAPPVNVNRTRNLLIKSQGRAPAYVRPVLHGAVFPCVGAHWTAPVRRKTPWETPEKTPARGTAGTPARS